MKLMTYNIYRGAVKTLAQVIDIVKAENPDFLTINEANNFADNDQEILKRFAREAGFPYFELARWEDRYDVAAFSKHPFKKSDIVRPIKRAYLISVIDTPFGEMAIASIHLSHVSEDERLKEIEVILDFQSQYENRVIMGDMNALSRQDGYDPSIVGAFNQNQIGKFTTGGRLRHEAVDKVLAAGYIDAAVQLGQHRESTVPTLANEDLAHAGAPMRLDYIFLSDALSSRLKTYSVVKDKASDAASDHYPVVAEIE